MSLVGLIPSGSALSNLSQLREYLQTSGTCKCGLPCPLRPETAFSFDPKVVSKPYQVAAGAELTKLCNHKRKLLASLQSRVQSPVTPPPQTIEQKKGNYDLSLTL
ncbi:jg23256 [Pararge aegeria aegeria]|uniref:Jg23256 protein n=1 Tax=Pararge aegeria aegeria TaxID=348720 RepID=A0A8S4QGS4_9NEOP|nr:jg23256 [Pararge aegeria aegeria]